jgi:type I restriction enzyme M protein
MVEVIDPKKTDTVLDPACGTAGFLISSYKHILKANVDPNGSSTLTLTRRAASHRTSRATTSHPTWCASRW